MNHIAQSWLSYRQKVLPKNATADQIEQVRIAFYAGCIYIMEVNNRIGEPDMSEEKSLKMLTDIQNEIKAFLKSIGR